ncbi:MAG TPA: Na(+)/H(+) antiporter subunit B [Candidatus Syntrophosphaera sp.]|nr:Na(+)/H(+) antiporter subunit B [Candidatus Syntrophosphaera sp.]
MSETILLVLLALICLLSALYSIFTRKVLHAVIASGVISLTASIIYLLVAAPDVAMTEATIGAGLTTVVFLYTLKQVKEDGDD